METALTPVTTLAQPVIPAALVAQTQDYIRNAKATNTQDAYRSDWEDFSRWCEQHGCTALPAVPETVAVYLTDLITHGRKVNTLARRLVSISQAHKYAGLLSPTSAAIVREAMKGIRREHGSQAEAVDALTTDDIRTICRALPDSLIGKRDRALLLFGFAGAFRRSELVSLNLNDVQVCHEGLRLTIRRSKTDQEGEGRIVGIPFGSDVYTCPVRAYQTWLAEARISEGAIFRGLDKGGHLVSTRLSDRAVAQIVQRATKRAGLAHKHVAGHSLRAGHATSAARAGVSERVIMKQTGHKTERMVRRYIREGELFNENSATRLGL